MKDYLFGLITGLMGSNVSNYFKKKGWFPKILKWLIIFIVGALVIAMSIPAFLKLQSRS